MKLKMFDTFLDIDGLKLFIDENFNEKNFTKISKFIVASSHETPWDQHNVNELWIIFEGSGIISIRDNFVNFVSKGDIFFIDSNIQHKIKNTGETDLIIFSIWWDNNGI